MVLKQPPFLQINMKLSPIKNKTDEINYLSSTSYINKEEVFVLMLVELVKRNKITRNRNGGLIEKGS
jgi:hypothetical protein